MDYAIYYYYKFPIGYMHLQAVHLMIEVKLGSMSVSSREAVGEARD